MNNTQPIVEMISPEEVSGKAKEIYDSFISQGKEVPKWVQVMAQCDDVLVGFFTMFKATMDDAPLPALLKWKVADEVSRLNQCAFCVDVTQAQLKQFGLSEKELSDIHETANEREKVALRYAKLVTEQAYKIDPEFMNEVKQHFNDEELVELTAAISLFNYINRFNDALGVLPQE
jgi:AhpD family alkylhydroperoxidase